MRQTLCFNHDWLFSKDNEHWEAVTLPHTWNAADGCDGKGAYYRGECYYKKDFLPPRLRDGERLFLDIPALSLCGKVYVNGREAGSHEGGYSSFAVDITDFLNPEAYNELLITADNSEHSHIYPQMADFTFYGGLYRGISLLILSSTHFDVSFHGAKGFAITSEVTLPSPRCDVPAIHAMLHLNSWVINGSEDYTICYTIYNREGEEVAQSWRSAVNPKADILLTQPHLWQGVDDPYLYCTTARLVYRNEVVDEVHSRFGIRSFHVDSQKGFFLNGKPMMLRGVSRHQDKLYKGYALSYEDHLQDAELIREIGANTIRLAHYQHSSEFYDICDEYGFIVWAEIPYISGQSDDPAAHVNSRSQLTELIYQNYNHPCICFWGLSNEITIMGEKEGVVENHKDLQALAKSLDPTRLTTVAHVTMLPMDSPLHGITDLESYNHYFGWYGGSYTQNEKWLDEFHAKYPDICLGLSEYGAEGIITYQPDEPKCRDYSESYQAVYHEHMAKILAQRPWLWSTYVWNMFDFGCAARDEGGVAGRNNKGLVTMDRQIKKEAFYVYKAYWSREPFVYLCGRRYSRRAADTTTVKIYSNQSRVSLYVNGELFDTQCASKIFIFENVPLGEGFTFLHAAADDCCDNITLEKVSEKPDIYTLPQEDEEHEGVANWFAQSIVVPNDTCMEFSPTHFSVYDKVKDILANDKAAEILEISLYSLTGMKLKKSMLGMLAEKTVMDLAAMMKDMGNSKNAPENAMEIINAALNQIAKEQ